MYEFLQFLKLFKRILMVVPVPYLETVKGFLRGVQWKVNAEEKGRVF